jgi:excisionase family DNA binding protein
LSEGADRDWLTVAQVAQRLQLHEETIRRWIRDGQFPVLDLGKKAGYRIRPADLDTFIAERYGLVGKDTPRTDLGGVKEPSPAGISIG